jgi:hypothetical protein
VGCVEVAGGVLVEVVDGVGVVVGGQVLFDCSSQVHVLSFQYNGWPLSPRAQGISYCIGTPFCGGPPGWHWMKPWQVLGFGNMQFLGAGHPAEILDSACGVWHTDTGGDNVVVVDGVVVGVLVVVEVDETGGGVTGLVTGDGVVVGEQLGGGVSGHVLLLFSSHEQV